MPDPVDPVRRAVLERMAGDVDPRDVAALVANAVDVLDVVGAALAVCGSWVWHPAAADADPRLVQHTADVAGLLVALERAGFLERGSTLYPAAMRDLSPRDGSGGGGVIRDGPIST